MENRGKNTISDEDFEEKFQELELLGSSSTVEGKSESLNTVVNSVVEKVIEKMKYMNMESTSRPKSSSKGSPSPKSSSPKSSKGGSPKSKSSVGSSPRPFVGHLDRVLAGMSVVYGAMNQFMHENPNQPPDVAAMTTSIYIALSDLSHLLFKLGEVPPEAFLDA